VTEREGEEIKENREVERKVERERKGWEGKRENLLNITK
jgi:hypothetical protein